MGFESKTKIVKPAGKPALLFHVHPPGLGANSNYFTPGIRKILRTRCPDARIVLPLVRAIYSLFSRPGTLHQILKKPHKAALLVSVHPPGLEPRTTDPKSVVISISPWVLKKWQHHTSKKLIMQWYYRLYGII